MAEEQTTDTSPAEVPLAEITSAPTVQEELAGKEVSFPTSVTPHVHDGVDSPRIRVLHLINDSRARAYLTGNQTITAGNNAKITLNTETYDTLNQFDSTTNYRFTVKIGQSGYYLITTRVGFTASATTDIHQIQIRVNNAIVAENRVQSTTTDAHSFGIDVSDIRLLAVGDYVEVFVDSDALSNYTVIAGTTSTFLSIHRIS